MPNKLSEKAYIFKKHPDYSDVCDGTLLRVDFMPESVQQM